MIDHDSPSSAWRRLLDGDVRAIPTFEGKLDLRGVVVPAPKAVNTRASPIGVIADQVGLTVLRGVHWRGIDFARSTLPELRFFDSVLEDCVFDGAACRGWRMWNSRIVECSFARADLRGSALGGLVENKRNEFLDVDFTNADLRQTAFTAAKFERCKFQDTKLDKVDFQGSEFVDCEFAGVLKEVVFARRPFRARGLPENRLEGVDFSRAKLRSVEFKDLDLDEVALPTDADHIVVERYRELLDEAIAELSQRDGHEWKRLRAYLTAYRRRSGPHQRRGVFNRTELVDLVGEAGARFMEDIASRSRR